MTSTPNQNSIVTHADIPNGNLKTWHKPELSVLDHSDTFVNKDQEDTTEGTTGLGKTYGIPS